MTPPGAKLNCELIWKLPGDGFSSKIHTSVKVVSAVKAAPDRANIAESSAGVALLKLPT